MQMKTEWNGVTLYTEDLSDGDPRIPEGYEGGGLYQVDVWTGNTFRVGFTVKASSMRGAADKAKRYLASFPPLHGI
jgi:hypothetical protein